MKNPDIVLAILGGSAIIALGLYFGLQARAPSANAPVASLTGTPSSLPAPPATAIPQVPGDIGTLGVPDRGVEEQRRVEEGVRAQILELKPAIVERCWRPSSAKAPEPKRVKLSWNGTIGPQGGPLAFGVSPNREAYRADIQDCLQRELGKLKIADPPAAPTQITVEFELP